MPTEEDPNFVAIASGGGSSGSDETTPPTPESSTESFPEVTEDLPKPESDDVFTEEL